MKTTIYGIFNRKNGVCEYVGRTRNPKARKRVHLFCKPHLEFKVLATVEKFKESEVEGRFILAYKKLGQAERNVRGMNQARTAKIVRKIKAMTPAPFLILKTDAERQDYLRTAANLRQCGQIKFDVVTKQFGDKGYKIIAV